MLLNQIADRLCYTSIFIEEDRKEDEVMHLFEEDFMFRSRNCCW